MIANFLTELFYHLMEARNFRNLRPSKSQFPQLKERNP